MQDTLDAGLVFDSIISINGDAAADYDPPASGAGSNFSYALSAQPAAGAVGTLRWEFGDIANPPSNDGTPIDALVIRYVAKVVIAEPPDGVAHDPSGRA